MEGELDERWARLIDSLKLSRSATEATYQELIKAYDDPNRYYHNLEHLAAILSTIETLAAHAVRPDLVQLAAWFHDAVYDSRAADNEEHSALLAETTCTAWGLPVDDVKRVGDLVRATRTHDAPEEDVDASVLLDADLAILGVEESEYAAYAAAIRREYAWVAEADYRRERARMLERLLRRDRLYRLEEMHRRFEARARGNLAKEIETLTG